MQAAQINPVKKFKNDFLSKVKKIDSRKNNTAVMLYQGCVNKII